MRVKAQGGLRMRGPGKESMFQRDLVVLRWTAGLFALALWVTPVAAQTGDSAPTDFTFFAFTVFVRM